MNELTEDLVHDQVVAVDLPDVGLGVVEQHAAAWGRKGRLLHRDKLTVRGGRDASRRARGRGGGGRSARGLIEGERSSQGVPSNPKLGPRAVRIGAVALTESIREGSHRLVLVDEAAFLHQQLHDLPLAASDGLLQISRGGGGVM